MSEAAERLDTEALRQKHANALARLAKEDDDIADVARQLIECREESGDDE